jgi:hypothetical protein
VHAWSEPLLVRYTAKERPELQSFLIAERPADRIVVGSRDAADLRHGLLSPVCQSQGIKTPILRVVAPLDETALFELVDVRDEAARHNSQEGRERLLADSRVRSDDAKYSRVSGDEIDLRQAFGETCRGVSPDLR